MQHPDWCDPGHGTAGFTLGTHGAQQPIGQHQSGRLRLTEGFTPLIAEQRIAIA
jgi:hypothetical protein